MRYFVLACVLMLFGCTESSTTPDSGAAERTASDPGAVAAAYLDATLKYDYRRAYPLVSAEDQAVRSLDAYLDEHDTSPNSALAKKMAAVVKYEITGSDVRGDTARVTASVTMPDEKALMADMVALAFSGALGENSTEEDVEAALGDREIPVLTEDRDVRLVRESSGWRIDEPWAEVAAYTKLIELLDIQAENRTSVLDDQPRAWVSGRLKNGGSETLGRVLLGLTFKDGTGQPIFEDDCNALWVNDFSEDKPMKAGYIAEFNCTTEGVPVEWGGQVDVSVQSVEMASE